MPRILVVDDNSDILMLLRVTFEGAGHEVFASQSPLAAMPLIEEHAPDAVVLDVMMPELSGWDVLREIRRRPETKALPVVLLTALSDVTDRVRGLRGGADDYQLKPFEPEEILARVEGLIERRAPKPAPPPPPEPARPPVAAESLGEAVAELERRIAAGVGLDGLRLGRYEVRELLGRGAMGTVLSGWDPKLRRAVALKTIRFKRDGSGREDRKTQVSRLLREAVANARINHSNIVTVYDVGDEGSGGNAAFIAMELVEGTSLYAHLRDCGKLSVERLVPLAAAVSWALAAAHELEIVHRDIKPSNVLLGDDGSIKVSDFGIAELVTQTSHPGTIFGTPGYLAPESLTGELSTPASDLFSLGVTLYECLTGVHPFVERNWRRSLHNTIMKDPKPLARVVPGVPKTAAEMVSRLLEKEPKRRPKEASEVAELFDLLATAEGWKWTLEAPRAARSKRLTADTSRSRLLTRTTLNKTLRLGAAPA